MNLIVIAIGLFFVAAPKGWIGKIPWIGKWPMMWHKILGALLIILGVF